MSSMANPALSKGSAPSMMNALTKLIHTNSGTRRSVMPGARMHSTVVMMLIAVATEPMPSTKREIAQ